jgi:SpoIVB peptidase S55
VARLLRVPRLSLRLPAPALLIASLAAGGLLALGANVPLARGDAQPATISPAEIKEGMKGYGLTVFKGTRPERFDVEVIGVLHNFRPGQQLIVVKTPNPRLDVVKTVKGMSGSPIYLDGRLAGAYSYSLSAFEVEPVAGVTPIDLMLTEMRRPIPAGLWPAGGAAPLPGAPAARAPAPPAPQDQHASLSSFDGPPGSYDLVEHARQLAERMGAAPGTSHGMTPAATPLMMSGVGDRALEALRKLVEPLGLEPLQGGGGSELDPGAPTHFVDGGGLGVQLARGDVSVMGLGTATYVDGQGRVAGFGHPMLNGGDEQLPACIGRVLWIDASAQASHKVGECARPLGTLVQDRQSAIIVDERIVAPVIPVDLEIAGVVGAPKLHWHAELTDDKFLGPGLAATILESAIEATTSERRDVTWSLTSRVTIAGHGAVDLEDVGVASGGTPDASDWIRSKVVTTVGDVLNNPWEHAHIEGVKARFEVKFARDLWRLRGVDVLDPVVDAGHVVRLRLHLVPENGPEVTRVVETTMPEELAGKDVDIDVVPGYDVVPELPAPENLDQMLANEPRQTIDGRTVVLQFRVPSQGIAYRGHVTQRLPPFTLDALRPQSNDTGPDPFQSWSRTVRPLDLYMEGRDKVKVKVRTVLR